MNRMWHGDDLRLLSILGAWLSLFVASCGGDSVAPAADPVEPDTAAVVSSISVLPSERTIGILGVPVGVRALALADDGKMLYGSFLDPGRFSWSSSAPGVATINEENPLITGVSEGTATITAISQSVTGSMTVTVRDHARFVWSASVGTGSISSGLAIGIDGTIYVGVDDFAANRSVWYAISPQGSVLWTLGLPLTWPSTPAIGPDGTLYLGSRTSLGPTGFTGRLIAVDPGGAVRWMLDEIDGLRSSPALGADGTIYVAGGQHVYAVDPQGEILWAYEHEDDVFVFSSPAIGADGTIYVGGADGLLYAINPGGSLRWTFESEDLIQSSPSIGVDGTIYFGSMDGRLYALQRDGTERWSIALDERGIGRSSPSIGPDGTIYVSAGGVFAIAPGGSVRWEYGGPSAGIVTTPIVGADGTVYVGAPFGAIALDSHGRLLWDYGTGGRVGGTPAIGVDGTLVSAFFSDPFSDIHDGTVHAIRENAPSNGGFEGAPWPTERGNRASTGRASGR